MQRRCRIRLGRAKGGVSAWSPNRAPSIGNRPNNTVLTWNELKPMAFRPLPREHTVEMEQDVGFNTMIQREYIGPDAETTLPSRAHGVARSPTELQALRREYARDQGKAMAARSRHGTTDASPEFQVSQENNAGPGATASARYLFDEGRMAFLQRFHDHFGAGTFDAVGEACAVLHGVKAPTEEDRLAAMEGWFASFLEMDAASMQHDAEEGLHTSAGDGRAPGTGVVNVHANPHGVARVATALSEEEEEEENHAEHAADEEGEDDTGAARESAVQLPGEAADFAAVYQAYADYCSGETSAARGVGVMSETVGSVDAVRQKAQWRELLTVLSQGDFHRADNDTARAALADLEVRLGTVRLFDTRVGQIAAETARVRSVETRADSGGMSEPTNPSLRRGNQ